MKKVFLLLALITSIANMQAQTLSSLIDKFMMPMQISNGETIENARAAVVEEDFDRALHIYGIIIDKQKQDRHQGSQVSNELLAEYAYVLALVGAQEASLINLDLALNLKTPSRTIAYYTASILDVIGFGDLDLSKSFAQQGKQPTWLYGRGFELNKKYRGPILINIDRADIAMTHISECINDSRLIEALCYSTYLVQLTPDMQSAWFLLSTVYENLGYYTSALACYDKGLTLSPDDKSLPGMEKQLTYLQKKSRKTGNTLTNWQMYDMLYGGVTVSNGNTSLNVRYGISSGPLSVSFNERFNISKHGDVSAYTGMSLYHNINKLFYGLGAGLQTTGDSNVFSLSPTVGFSLYNAKHTSSFDVSIEYNIPCKSGMTSSFAISVGKTLYFKSKSKGKSK